MTPTQTRSLQPIFLVPEAPEPDALFDAVDNVLAALQEVAEEVGPAAIGRAMISCVMVHGYTPQPWEGPLRRHMADLTAIITRIREERDRE